MKMHRLIIRTVLLLSLACCAISFASDAFADEPVPHVKVRKQAAKYLKMADVAAKKARLNLKLGQTVGEVCAMLNAGRFDSVYRVLLSDKFQFSQGLKLANRYCFEMAAAGHADELKQQLPSFKDTLFVKPTLNRHKHLTVDILFKRPILNGLAVLEARKGNLKLAVEHLNAIKELPTKPFYLFVNSCVEEVGSRLLFDKMDAQCAELIALFCGDNHRKAAGIIRGIFAGSSLYVSVEFMEALPVAYHPAAQREIHFFLDDSRVSKEHKIACLDWAFENLQPAKDNSVLALRYDAIRHGVLPADPLTELLEQYFAIQSHERGKLLTTQRPLVEELLRTDNHSEASRVLLHAGENVDPSLVASVARRKFQLGLAADGLQILNLRIKPTGTRRRYPIPKLLPVLLEGKAFDEAVAYAEFLDEKKSQPEGFSSNIIELYRTLAKPADSSLAELRSNVHEAIKDIGPSDVREFARVANVPRFVASLATAHGAQAAYEISSNELQALFTYGYPVGETIAVLLLDGKNGEALEYSKCWKPEDKLSFSEKVSVTSPRIYNLDIGSEVIIGIVDAFGEKLKYDPYFQRAQIRNAIKLKQKDVALKVVQQAILDEPEFYISGMFTEHGWDRELISRVAKLEKEHTNLRGLTDRTLETLADDFFVKRKHDQAAKYALKISGHRKRIQTLLSFAAHLLEVDTYITEPTDWIDNK